MGISGLDQTVVAAQIQGNVSDRQGRLLCEVLTCSSPSALAAGRASLQATLVLSLPVLIDSLSSFAVSSQPEQKLIEKIRDATIKITRDLMEVFPGEAGLASIHHNLCQLEAFDDLIENQKAGIKRISLELARDLESIELLIDRLTTKVWTGKSTLPKKGIERVSHEISALRAESDADYSGLVGDVQNLARNPNRKSYLTKLLNPSTSLFKVVVGISGTKRFKGLDSFFEAHQFSRGDEKSAGWGVRTETLEAFTGAVPDRAAVVFLQLRIDAPDRQSAARKVRRRVSEVLDQYVAGHRLTDLRLTDGAAVFDCERHSAALDYGNGPGVSLVKPLTVDWPIRLRESLRMGHLAVIGDSPMTQIALSWSAIEAAGVCTQDVGMLASALTLQTLRHQINESYMYLSQGFRTKERVLDSMANGFLGRYERAKDLLEKETHPKAVDSLKKKIIELESEGTSLAAIFAKNFLDSKGFDEIDKYVVSDERGYPISINAWADLLQPSMMKPGLEAGRAHRQVRTLQKHLDGVHLARLANWQQRFADSMEFENWCSEQRLRFEQALIRIYAVRNVVIHAGAVTVRGDVVLADSGIAIVDLFHEVLGNWSRVSKERQLDEMSPREVLIELQRRLESVIQAAHDGQIGTINFDHLTSPTSTSTDRTL